MELDRAPSVEPDKSVGIQFITRQQSAILSRTTEKQRQNKNTALDTAYTGQKHGHGSFVNSKDQDYN